MKTKNPIAKALSCGLFQKKVVKSKKGRGSYCRKSKAPKGAFSLSADQVSVASI